MSSESGKLVYIMGASGAGKDHLLRALAEQLSDDVPVRIARRWITRPALDQNETHCALSHEEFAQREHAGQFALSWNAHGLHYGIDREIENWLASGDTVIVNGSRAYLPKAQTRFNGSLLPLLVDVPASLLADRLRQRGRESEQAIRQRLARHDELLASLPDDVITVDNSRTPAEAVEALLTVLRQTTGAPCG